MEPQGRDATVGQQEQDQRPHTADEGGEQDTEVSAGAHVTAEETQNH